MGGGRESEESQRTLKGDKMIDLSGRKALVTGGSRGIGRATAVLLAKAGAEVAITYQRQEKAALDVKSAVESLGRRGLALKAEISNEAEVRHAVDDMVSVFGRVDILVNNAGIWTYLEIGSGKTKDWEKTMEDNQDRG